MADELGPVRSDVQGQEARPAALEALTSEDPGTDAVDGEPVAVERLQNPAGTPTRAPAAWPLLPAPRPASAKQPPVRPPMTFVTKSQ